MAAVTTVAEAAQAGKFSQSAAVPMPLSRPRKGVIVLCGYGTSVRVDHGHLVIEDGVGSDRYKGRFPRVGHGLERLVVIGADGVVSLAALRWLADQNASFVMLERMGMCWLQPDRSGRRTFGYAERMRWPIIRVQRFELAES